jgi:predicted dehydrogenase
MNRKKRFAVVGTGGRAGMFIQAITDTYRDWCELTALCDLSQTRMDWHNQQIQTQAGVEPVPTYQADQFEAMITDTHPDTVIVATIDATHHLYINRAMELGCDVITEKPMTTDAEKARSIFNAIERTGKELRVTFNYRYAPAFTKLRELLMQGVVGRPLSVDFSWLLDTYHGADYFRRWHREKQNSGGLLVHKATHHFDLVNWWIDSYPDQVFAFGDLLFYGRQNAAARGETYPYTRYTGVPEAREDPFALFLDQDAALRGLYLEAEADSGYIRDRNVFGEPITIEDTMAVTARYRNGVILSYCLIAYSPWEGLSAAITGTKGRVELSVIENVNLVSGQGESHNLQASKGPFKQASLRVFPMFGEGYDVEFSAADGGGHGGADPIMLEQLFSPHPTHDPFNRTASHVDGAASIMLGIAANRAMETNQPVRIDDLFRLPKKTAINLAPS